MAQLRSAIAFPASALPGGLCASAGALIAPFAFLGSRYDDQLRDSYTTISAIDIFEVGGKGESFLEICTVFGGTHELGSFFVRWTFMTRCPLFTANG